MSKIAVFIQVQDKAGITETELPESASLQDIFDALKQAGVDIDEDMVVFVDDAEAHEERECKHPVKGLKRGCRIHVTRCHRVEVTVNFLEKTIDRVFPPGARVRAVKQWAVRELKLNPTDAGEHVLQLCGTTRQPATDTPLAELVEGCKCGVCFDLVPEKRVEG